MISGGIEVNLLKIAYHLERNLCKSTLLISSEIIWKETRILLVFSQLTFTFSKSTTETLEKGVKYFQSYIGEREGEPSKNWVTWGEGGRVPKITLKIGDWYRNGGVATFLLLYSSIAFTVCCEKVKFPLLHFDSSVFWVSYATFSS